MPRSTWRCRRTSCTPRGAGAASGRRTYVSGAGRSGTPSPISTPGSNRGGWQGDGLCAGQRVTSRSPSGQCDKRAARATTTRPSRTSRRYARSGSARATRGRDLHRANLREPSVRARDRRNPFGDRIGPCDKAPARGADLSSVGADDGRAANHRRRFPGEHRNSPEGSRHHRPGWQPAR
jgi:hypothetical protein